MLGCLNQNFKSFDFICRCLYHWFLRSWDPPPDHARKIWLFYWFSKHLSWPFICKTTVLNMQLHERCHYSSDFRDLFPDHSFQRPLSWPICMKDVRTWDIFPDRSFLRALCSSCIAWNMSLLFWFPRHGDLFLGHSLIFSVWNFPSYVMQERCDYSTDFLAPLSDYAIHERGDYPIEFQAPISDHAIHKKCDYSTAQI